MNPSLFPSGSHGAPSRKEDRDLIQGIIHALKAPLIVWPGYEDGYRSHRDMAASLRLLHPQDMAEGRCTEFEAMLYLSSASLAFPPRAGWVRIYEYLFARCMPVTAAANSLDSIKALDPSEAEDLAGLRRWIFKTQALHLRGLKEDATPEVRRLKREVEAEQPRLF